MARLLRCSQGHFVNPARHKECPVCAADPPELQPDFVDFEAPPPPSPSLLGWLVQVEGPERGRDQRIEGSPFPVEGMGEIVYRERRFWLDGRPLAGHERVGPYLFVPLCGQHFDWHPAVRVDGVELSPGQAQNLLDALLQLSDWGAGRPVGLWNELPAHPHLLLQGERPKAPTLEQRPPQNLDELIQIAVQLAWGLAAAHEWGIAHGDVRPANVYLTPGVKLAGFGLPAQPAYRAPEPGPSPAGDVWSWGLTVLFMALGRQAWNQGEEAWEVLAGLSPRIALPTRLEAILRRCFALNPGERPASLLEVARELCADTPPAGGEPGARLYLQVARREDGQEPLAGAPSDSLAEFEQAREILERLAARRPELEPMLASLCRREAALRDGETALRLYDRAQTLLLKLVHARGKSERTRELAQVCLAKTALLEGEEARRLYQQAAHLLERLPGAELERARAHLRRADFERRDERPDEAQKQLQLCQALLAQLMEQGQPVASEQADWHFQQALLRAEQGDRDGALSFYEAAISLWRPLLEERGPDWSRQAASLASAWLNQGAMLAEGLDFRGAVEHQQKALNLLEEVVFTAGHGEHAELWATACVEQAEAQEALGEHSRALHLFNHVVTTLDNLVRQGRGELAAQWARAMVKRASAVAHSGATGQALGLFDETITLLDRCRQPELEPFRQLARRERDRAASSGQDRAAAARLCLEQARTLSSPAEAARRCQEATALFQELVEREQRADLLVELAEARAGYAGALEAGGDIHGAFRALEESRQWLESAVHEQGQTLLTEALAGVHYELARIHTQVGQLEAAGAAYQRSIALWEHLLKHGREDCRPALGRALVGLGLLDPASLQQGCQLLEQHSGLSLEDGALLARGWVYLARLQRHQGQPDYPLCERAGELCRQLPQQQELLSEALREGRLHHLLALARECRDKGDLRKVLAAFEEGRDWPQSRRLAGLLKSAEETLAGGRSLGQVMEQFCEVIQHG